jgi:hypothetical protein
VLQESPQAPAKAFGTTLAYLGLAFSGLDASLESLSLPGAIQYLSGATAASALAYGVPLSEFAGALVGAAAVAGLPELAAALLAAAAAAALATLADQAGQAAYIGFARLFPNPLQKRDPLVLDLACSEAEDWTAGG